MSVHHVPVLIGDIVRICAPIQGHWVDGTMGAGGYTRALMDAGAQTVTAIDRDPHAHALAQSWGQAYEGRLTTIQDRFSNMAQHAQGVEGVVLDLGVSSMQLDQAQRGFSFQEDGPLDMRMGDGPYTAADILAHADEGELADILFHFGEERQSRRIARRLCQLRSNGAHITTTRGLAEVIESVLPRAKPGQSHPATRSFQALRIAVNLEFEELIAALHAAEEMLDPGGVFAVVSFHSLEDRMVKRFFADRTDTGGGGNRHLPASQDRLPSFEAITKKAVSASEAERGRNPRARSALLRVARRTVHPVLPRLDAKSLGMPRVPAPLFQRGSKCA